MIVALIPAGGQSTRMGQPKLLLPFGERTVIEQVLSVIQSTGIERILVVAAPGIPELESTAHAAGADVVLLAQPTAQMRDTIQIGLAWIESHWLPNTDDDWLLVPADHPTIEPNVIRALLTARVAHPDHSIFVPTHDGHRGHPTLIRWRHVPALRDYPPVKGVNHFLRERQSETWEVAVDVPTVLDDLDTAEDYRRLRPSS